MWDRTIFIITLILWGNDCWSCAMFQSFNLWTDLGGWGDTFDFIALFFRSLFSTASSNTSFIGSETLAKSSIIQLSGSENRQRSRKFYFLVTYIWYLILSKNCQISSCYCKSYYVFWRFSLSRSPITATNSIRKTIPALYLLSIFLIVRSL